MKKACIYTFGCKVNQYDSQALRERLLAGGRQICERPEDADEVYINSCTVTGEADRQCRQLVRQLLKKKPGVKITVTGCYAKRAPDEIRSIAGGVEAEPSTVSVSGTGDPEAISAFEGHARAFVKVQDGCDAFCSYCIVPLVRPAPWSRSPDDVLAEIGRLTRKGYAEIVLTGVHLGRYAGGLSSLLERIAALPGDFRVRLSSIEIGEVDDRLLALMSANPEKICAHLHLPLQSGSDAVLHRMNRKYTTGTFAKRLETIRVSLPDAGITTDVIVGFPGETDADFRRTRDFLKGLGFSRLHVFVYSARPGTAAASYHDTIPREKALERSKTLREIDAGLQEEFWKRFIGETRRVVMEGEKNTLLTDNYIRLRTREELKNNTNINTIMTASICERNGLPWGEIIGL